MTVRDWLQTGWEIWDTAPTPSETVLCLPRPDPQGFRDAGASDQDRVALTIHIFDRILAADRGHGGKPTTRMASRLWTEHSSRSTVVPMARVLGTAKDLTDRLGGWESSRTSSETYIRTHRNLAEQVQEKVTAVCKADLDAYHLSQDIFDEGQVTEKFQRTVCELEPEFENMPHLETYSSKSPLTAQHILPKYG